MIPPRFAQTRMAIDGSDVWCVARDADPDCRALYRRHYSCYRYADGRVPKKFVGPGSHVVLVSPDGRALLVWRKFIDGAIPPQFGVCCSVFRREEGAAGPRASEMILAAEPFARRRWPLETRFYTYVDPSKVRAKRDPGRCFLRAGWRYQRDAKGMKVRTIGGLTILEKETP